MYKCFLLKSQKTICLSKPFVVDNDKGMTGHHRSPLSSVTACSVLKGFTAQGLSRLQWSSRYKMPRERRKHSRHFYATIKQQTDRIRGLLEKIPEGPVIIWAQVSESAKVYFLYKSTSGHYFLVGKLFGI